MASVRRPEIAQRIHDAKEHGDLSENAEYEDAKNEQAFVEGRIQTLESMIKNATLIDEHTSTDHVQIGSTVKVKGEDGAETFTIVGSAEAKPAAGASPTSRRSAAPCSAARRARRSRQGPRRRLLLHDRRDQLAPPAHGHRRRARGRTRHGRERAHVDWADELAASVQGPQVVNDSKTPSGTVHVGSLRGPVILDVITRALRAPRPARRRSSTASTTWTRWTPRRSCRPTPSSARWAARSPTSPTRSATATRRYARHSRPDVHRHSSPASASTPTATTG